MIKSMKRFFVQFGVFLVTNLHLQGFFKGTIFQGSTKHVCVPGLNCYSCPGAMGSCPIGALQAVIGSAKYQISYYVVGLLTFFGVLLGRFICGWLCPFGMVQDLLNKVKTKKWKVPAKIDRPLRYLKYVILVMAVILLPMFATNAFGIGKPYFCQYICPSGTLFGGIPLMISNPALRQAAGFLFSWKMGLLLLFLILSLFISRPFCKYVCPLGAVYALFNKVSFYQMEVDKEKCIHCGKCEHICPMQVPVVEEPNHPECIRCGECKGACPVNAIKGVRKKSGKKQV